MKRATSAGSPGAVVARLALIAVVLGCGEKEFDPPDREAQVEQASARFDAASFDSIAWESETERGLAGNVVYATYCRNCHGPLGRGQTDYALNRNLEVPSLVEPGWRYEGQVDSVLHRVFAGHVEGMPTWGVAGISPREMDAVAYYILDVLRPEVLSNQ